MVFPWVSVTVSYGQLLSVYNFQFLLNFLLSHPHTHPLDGVWAAAVVEQGKGAPQAHVTSRGPPRQLQQRQVLMMVPLRQGSF